MLGIIVVLISYLFATSTSQIPCPVPWWYCLNRDPSSNSQVLVVDTSNRSAKWNWNAGNGKWEVYYHHSFTTGYYGMQACYTRTVDSQQSCVAYENNAWKSNAVPINNVGGWDMAYNGDIFGFKPQSNGQYIFHIYSRKLEHNPFTQYPTGPPQGPSISPPYTPPQTLPPSSPPYNPPQTLPPRKQCSYSTEEITQGRFWTLERKSKNKCTLTINKNEMTSPCEWSWDTDSGKWIVIYNWMGYGVTNSTVYYQRDGLVVQNKLIEWIFDPNALTVSYSASPVNVYQEGAWKLKIIGKETFGYTPLYESQWTFSIFSRNVLIRPFEKSSGIFNLQQIYYNQPNG